MLTDMLIPVWQSKEHSRWYSRNVSLQAGKGGGQCVQSPAIFYLI